MNLNMQAVQRRHQPPMQHSESSETSPANADNAAAAALRAAADAADAAARCKDPEVFWAVLKAAATAATQAAALSAPQSSATPTHRRGGRPPRGPRKPRAPRQPRNQQRSVQHPDPTANSPGPRSEQSRTQQPGASFISSNPANALSLVTRNAQPASPTVKQWNGTEDAGSYARDCLLSRQPLTIL